MSKIKDSIYQKKLNIPYSENTEILKTSISVSGKVIPNRIAVQPMEGCDANTDGTFGELTKRRYERFAKSGAGLIWFEATAICNEGKANPRQLRLTKESFYITKVALLAREMADQQNKSE